MFFPLFRKRLSVRLKNMKFTVFSLSRCHIPVPTLFPFHVALSLYAPVINLTIELISIGQICCYLFLSCYKNRKLLIVEDEESVVPENEELVGEGDFWHGLNLKIFNLSNNGGDGRWATKNPKNVVQNDCFLPQGQNIKQLGDDGANEW